jgi:hypothetical protein
VMQSEELTIDTNSPFQHLHINDTTHTVPSHTNTHGQVDMFSQGLYTPYQMTATAPYPNAATSTPIHPYHFHPYQSNPRDCESPLLLVPNFPRHLSSPITTAMVSADIRRQRNEESIPHIPNPTNVPPTLSLATGLIIFTTPFPKLSFPPQPLSFPTRIPRESRIPLPVTIYRYSPQPVLVYPFSIRARDEYGQRIPLPH